MYLKFEFKKLDISNINLLKKYIIKKKIDIIINLAAQAGVRHSIYEPEKYFKSNVRGFFNILELCREFKIKHLIFASTSSVYGASQNLPSDESHHTSKPLSFYAASKKSNEVFAYSYSNIYKIPITGLRFFTVYGPFGRPDMALYKFIDNIYMNKKIPVFNFGKHKRDFTFIDDVVESLYKIVNKIPKTKIPFQIFNVGSNNPKNLKYFIKVIERNLKLKAKINNLPLQKGDIKNTHADISNLIDEIGYKPRYDIENGIKEFISWYKAYYKK